MMAEYLMSDQGNQLNRTALRATRDECQNMTCHFRMANVMQAYGYNAIIQQVLLQPRSRLIAYDDSTLPLSSHDHPQKKPAKEIQEYQRQDNVPDRPELFWR